MIIERRQRVTPDGPRFNFCHHTWKTDEPCPDYTDDGGEHLCGENINELGHIHTCSCTEVQR